MFVRRKSQMRQRKGGGLLKTVAELFAVRWLFNRASGNRRGRRY